MNLKKFTPLFVIAFLFFTITACNKDETTNDGNIAIKAKATFNSTANKSGVSAKAQNDITITTFLINIKEIEFEIDDDNDDNDEAQEDFFGIDEIELEGPFELDLSSSNTAIDITSLDLPNNTYDEIEFELHKSENTSSELFGKSILIKGTLNGTPFVFWHDTDEEFEVDYSDQTIDIIVNGTDTSTVINFDLSIIFGPASTIDFSTAIDRDQDGVIEINPDNDDGNGALADFIKNLLEESSDLLDDEDDSDD